MNKAMIKVEGLGKKYSLRVVGATTLREDLGRMWDRFRGRTAPADGGDFWALRDVSFQAGAGEVLGIIGRNGAGKSTLLKIISRVTEPTKGRAVLRGRVASLLEVGTGFHPDLTGRENVFLNGAILGMRSAEIAARFDAIVDFAAVDRFIDTPVKHYSSGMRVRLAFAVAAHLEAEILIIDEVLAVGDAEFQQKCLGKMQHVARGEGRTVLFVSHNMAAVQALCTRILHLAEGKTKSIGPVDEQIEAYMRGTGFDCSGQLNQALGPSLELRQVNLIPTSLASGEALVVTIHLLARNTVRLTDISVLIFSVYGVRVAILDLRPPNGTYQLAPGEHTIRGRVPSLPLVEGEYTIGLYVRTPEVQENLERLTVLSVKQRKRDSGPIPYSPHHRGFVDIAVRVAAETDVNPT